MSDKDKSMKLNKLMRNHCTTCLCYALAISSFAWCAVGVGDAIAAYFLQSHERGGFEIG